jgi:hypothetical protein
MPHDAPEVGVLPILEAVLVVQKRLCLPEEVRVTRRRTTRRQPHQVTLRRAVVEIERLAPSEPATSPTAASGAGVRAGRGGCPWPAAPAPEHPAGMVETTLGGGVEGRVTEACHMVPSRRAWARGGRVIHGVRSP